MAARKSGAESIFNELFRVLRYTPWWVGPTLAAIVFVTLQWALPYFVGQGSDGGSTLPIDPGVFFSRVGVILAPFAAGVVLLLWAFALAAKWQDARRLDTQRDIDTIRELPWREFELLLAEAFRRQGYKVRETAGGADGGIDLELHRDGEHVVVQCKQWRRDRVGVKLVRELHGIAAGVGADRSIFVTSGGYTREARSFAGTVGMELIDGERLQALVAEVQRQGVAAGAAGEPAPVIEPPENPLCPRCAQPMVKRTAWRGKRTGEVFWGCSAFPACRGTRQV